MSDYTEHELATDARTDPWMWRLTDALSDEHTSQLLSPREHRTVALAYAEDRDPAEVARDIAAWRWEGMR